MDFLFAMSVFSSAADVSLDRGRAQEWLRAWVTRDGGAAAAAEQGKLPQRRQDVPEAQEEKKKKKTTQGGRRPWLAPEFDGLNCFETIVSH